MVFLSRREQLRETSVWFDFFCHLMLCNITEYPKAGMRDGESNRYSIFSQLIFKVQCRGHDVRFRH